MKTTLVNDRNCNMSVAKKVEYICEKLYDEFICHEYTHSPVKAFLNEMCACQKYRRTG